MVVGCGVEYIGVVRIVVNVGDVCVVIDEEDLFLGFVVVDCFVEVVFVVVWLEWVFGSDVDDVVVFGMYDDFVDVFWCFEFYVFLCFVIVVVFVDVVIKVDVMVVWVFVCIDLYDFWVCWIECYVIDWVWRLVCEDCFLGCIEVCCFLDVVWVCGDVLGVFVLRMNC